MDFATALKEAREGLTYKTHYKLLEITHELYKKMKEKALNFSSIARKLNVSRARISALFSCQHNVTLKTLIAVADALDYEVEITLTPKQAHEKPFGKIISFEEKSRYDIKQKQKYKQETTEASNEVQVA